MELPLCTLEYLLGEHHGATPVYFGVPPVLHCVVREGVKVEKKKCNIFPTLDMDGVQGVLQSIQG